MALFILLYVGIEVTIGYVLVLIWSRVGADLVLYRGWIVTFLLRRRGGGPSTGYVTSGFFGGMTAGRLFLIPVTHFVSGNNSPSLCLH